MSRPASFLPRPFGRLHVMRASALLTTLITLCCLSVTAATVADEERARSFETRVRPLLSNRCFACHGEKKQEAGLRLDSREGLLKGSESGPVVIPRRPEESRLMQVVAYADDDVQMPPAGKLPDEEIQLLQRWVAAGAFWPSEETEPSAGQPRALPRTADGEIDFAQAAASHWAYRPIQKPTPPAAESAALVRSAIDRFVIRRLQTEGLSLSPEADRRTLMRRVMFDLVGIPPTYDQVQEFVRDDSPDAYDRLIDRLIASPLSGQRWGRHWLDVARYADTKGYVFTQNPKYPFAYTYRDYVVDALNADKPYDRFIVEQLAADQLGLPANDPTLAALGFLTVGGRFRNDQADIIDDRIDVVTRGLMGMTVGCARCHDHKYDPVPTADYYSLYGVFASSDEPETLPVIGEVEESAAYREYEAELKRREQAVDDYIAAEHEKLLRQAREHAVDYLVAVLQKEQRLPDENTVEFQYGAPREKLTSLWSTLIERRVRDQDPVFAPWQALVNLPAEGFVEQSAEWLEKHVGEAAAAPAVNTLVGDALQKRPPQSRLEIARLYGRLFTKVDRQWQRLLKSKGDPIPSELPDPAAEQVRRVLYGSGSLTDVPLDQAQRIFQRDQRDKIRALRRKIAEWNVESPGAPPRAMVLQDRERPVEPVIFLRGDDHRRGPRVPRRFPRVLAGAESPPFRSGSGRLELARAIASPDNPLTARVIVNRVWMHHFGTPLVATPSDFGTRSDPPTHPELLDWLAASFIEHDWSLKWLHREIMLSAVYRQASASVGRTSNPSERQTSGVSTRGSSSFADENGTQTEPRNLEARHRVSSSTSTDGLEIRPTGAAVDPENRLLWRMNRRRLEFEPMRDAMLFVAGRLDSQLGGRSVKIDKPSAPPRRTVYAFIDRNNFSSLLRTFDYPNPDATSPERPHTTVPQQTLYGMNAPFPYEMAKAVTRRPGVEAANTNAETAVMLYRIILGRDPDETEQRLATDFLDGSPKKREQLAQTLLLTNEFLFID